jgi:D-arabinose 1-dehydrogenase-like Zn-dependent alcohol dehydrogenase
MQAASNLFSTAKKLYEECMQAFVVEKYQKNGRLNLSDLPVPSVGDRDILVEVKAAGVNQLDLKIRDGEFKLLLPYKPPFVLGHDVSELLKLSEQGSKNLR